jgi:hypothetical protein
LFAAARHPLLGLAASTTPHSLTKPSPHSQFVVGSAKSLIIVIIVIIIIIEAVDEYLDKYYRDEFFSWRDRIGWPAGHHVRNNRIRYPIGDWDVSRVNDFTSVFDRSRNGKARNFNEDLS